MTMLLERPSVASMELAAPRQTTTDAQLIALWLHGRSAHTQRAYHTDAERFLSFTGVPLISVTLGDVQAFADSLTSAPASRTRTISAVKSLLAFGHRLGYLAFDVGHVVKLPKLKETLAERILSETDVQRMLALEQNARNRVLLRLLYASGGRVSEIATLKWRDLGARGDTGQVTLFGKGGKTRVVLLPASVWGSVTALPGAHLPDAPVFASRHRGGHLNPRQLERIVLAAARRAGLETAVSPHWLRHAHASHALDRGAPIHLVQATLGHSSVATTGKYLHARPTDSSARFLAV